jgi:hypothetical protein
MLNASRAVGLGRAIVTSSLGISIACALSLGVHAAGAQTGTAPATANPRLLPVAQEVAIALSAGPKTIQAGAGVYVLEAHGYVKVRETTNGFYCIINRDRPLNMKPTCYDREGSASILPVDLAFGALMMRGVHVEQIRHDIRLGFATGTYHSPRRPGVAYMLSLKNYNYDPSTGQLQHFPPHVMFYAPNLTNADIGSDGNFDPGLPSIGYQGPQGFMIVVMPTPSPAGGGTAKHAH